MTHEKVFKNSNKYQGACVWMVVHGIPIDHNGKLIGEFEVYRQEENGEKILAGHEFNYIKIRDYLLNFEFFYKVMCPDLEIIVSTPNLWNNIKKRLIEEPQFQWDENRPAIVKGRDVMNLKGRHFNFSNEWSNRYIELRKKSFYSISDWAQEFYSEDGIPLELDDEDFDSFCKVISEDTEIESELVKYSQGRATYSLNEENAKKALEKASLHNKYPNFNEVTNWRFVR